MLKLSQAVSDLYDSSQIDLVDRVSLNLASSER